MTPDLDPEPVFATGFETPRAADVATFQATVLHKLTYAVGKDASTRWSTIGSSPPRWPCATASSSAGWTRPAAPTATAASASIISRSNS